MKREIKELFFNLFIVLIYLISLAFVFCIFWLLVSLFDGTIEIPFLLNIIEWLESHPKAVCVGTIAFILHGFIAFIICTGSFYEE